MKGCANLTYLYCVPFATTMNSFGMTAANKCYHLYSVSFERTMDKFGMTAATDSASAWRPPHCLVQMGTCFATPVTGFENTRSRWSNLLNNNSCLRRRLQLTCLPVCSFNTVGNIICFSFSSESPRFTIHIRPCHARLHRVTFLKSHCSEYLCNSARYCGSISPSYWLWR